ncbi:hypothetical protein KOW79_015956 [Hemibagrus wyckioides]|uniref:Uncharacterized protein n=1 Tax=Hemibagrus wyckioides TaxID=337641 RepID=A0A9D3SHZ9_9TELE|nr:hypothetical protein KOW79_015956 [Hemibagrus wyckioides]
MDASLFQGAELSYTHGKGGKVASSRGPRSGATSPVEQGAGAASPTEPEGGEPSSSEQARGVMSLLALAHPSLSVGSAVKRCSSIPPPDPVIYAAF